ncbi:MAG: hypothetical protein IIB53_16535 [Planctomycetes bacterium]|nr:hypothetical protein [Planctomycetota bacterium]
MSWLRSTGRRRGNKLPSVGLSVLLLAVSVLMAWKFGLLSWSYWQEGGVNTSRSEVLRNVGLLGVGLVGLGFGIWRAWTAHRQTIVAEQGLITDRFSTAVEHLGHDRVTVRIGGLYALKRIAEDSPDRDHLAVMDVVTNFICSLAATFLF